MFAYIKGILIASQPTYVIVEANGIGYTLYIPSRMYDQLPGSGQTAQFFTSFVIREFSQTLYGFLTSHERDIFEILLSVTGIGPKLALSLIGHLTLPELHAAVCQQDLPALCKVPGVGKKTAERLIVELKDKLANMVQIFPSTPFITMTDSKSQRIQDAMLALINLGYTQSTAQKAIKQSMHELDEEADLTMLLTTSLKHIKN